ASRATSLIVARLLAVRVLPSRSRPRGDNVVIVTGIELPDRRLVNASCVDCADSAPRSAEPAVRKWTGLHRTLDCLVSRCPRWPGATRLSCHPVPVALTRWRGDGHGASALQSRFNFPDIGGDGSGGSRCS